jgi:hypothetical protein
MSWRVSVVFSFPQGVLFLPLSRSCVRVMVTGWRTSRLSSRINDTFAIVSFGNCHLSKYVLHICPKSNFLSSSNTVCFTRDLCLCKICRGHFTLGTVFTFALIQSLYPGFPGLPLIPINTLHVSGRQVCYLASRYTLPLCAANLRAA